MSRKLKERIEKEMHGRYDSVREALVINVIGLNGVDANRLRGELRKRQIELHVVKNRAMKRVLAGGPLTPLAGALAGPCALVTTPRTAVEAAKELVRLAPEFPKLELKVGLIEGIDAPLSIDALANMRSRTELLGDVVGLAVSPGRRVAGCLKGPACRVAGCVRAIVDRLEKGETIAKVA